MTVGTLVAPGVRRISLPLPLALKAVNAYLIEGDRGWALVDTGLHTSEGEQALRDGLRDAGTDLEHIGRAFVTHVHPDHIGMAGTLEAAGAEVVMHRPEAEHARRLWARDQRLVDEAYAWYLRHGMPADVDNAMRKAWVHMGERVDPIGEVTTAEDREELELGGRTLRMVWTAGHTDHHAVLFDEVDGVLFAGDHVLPKITSNISLNPWSRDDPLGDYLAALQAVRALRVKRVLPAHGEPFDDLGRRVDELLAHHAVRLAAVLDLVRGTERDAYAISVALFPNVTNPYEARFALAETLAHLRHLDRLGNVSEIGGDPIRWRAI